VRIAAIVTGLDRSNKYQHENTETEAEDGRFHDRTRGMINASIIAYYHPARP
jgi:hypothetical protein